MVKTSYYTVLAERSDGHVIAVNFLFRTAALINSESAAELRRIVADPQAYAQNPSANLKLFNALRRRLFLVDEDLDEFELMKMRSLEAKFSSEGMVVGLMPTLHCNFRCGYCYVSPKSPDMPLEMQEAVLAWLDTKPFRHLLCGWFGGEPLLRWDIVRTMLRDMQTLCRRKGSTFETMMSTNGYLLTQDTIRQLQDLNFSSVQITLDGPRQNHDQMRPLANGQGTFDVIVNNAIQLLELTEGITLKLRVNVDATNVDAVYELFEQLPPIFKDKRVIVYVKVVWPHPEEWGQPIERDSKSPHLFPQSVTVMKWLAEQGYSVNFMETFGHGGCLRCEYDFYNNFLVGPEGNLYKCGISFEVGDRVGHLTPEGKAILDLPKFVERMAKDPFSDERCGPCKLLPMCGGDCAYLTSLDDDMCYLDFISLEEAAEVIYLQQRAKLLQK